MSWQLIFTQQYTRKAAKFIKNHPDVENQYTKGFTTVRSKSAPCLVTLTCPKRQVGWDLQRIH